MDSPEHIHLPQSMPTSQTVVITILTAHDYESIEPISLSWRIKSNYLPQQPESVWFRFVGREIISLVMTSAYLGMLDFQSANHSMGLSVVNRIQDYSLDISFLSYYCKASRLQFKFVWKIYVTMLGARVNISRIIRDNHKQCAGKVLSSRWYSMVL